jgi:hypothetical protein
MSRYDDLLEYIPTGTFYASDGDILPYSNKPYAIQLTADSPAVEYGIFLNDVLIGEATSDSDSLVQVNLILALGSNKILLFNRQTGVKLTTYITTRNWATWLAGVADIIELLDDAITAINLNKNLETVDFNDIDLIWGRI